MAYGGRKSNGHVTDDATWPRKVKIMTLIRVGRNLEKQLEMLFSNNL